ncbi:MAG: DUF5615 family PIN-like protein [Anaerolineales bacterium]|nr:DUF5615 family PIN-like protein [Anaerolineales bacterium]
MAEEAGSDRPRLHLDADASQRALLEALVKRGHDVTRTPQPGLPMDADDDYQLLWATAQGRVIFTHNIRDFIGKTEAFPNHSGILLAHRMSYSLADLIRLIDRALSTTSAEDWNGRVRWLSDWKE